ncbi:hypothetical protein TREMEDRAFT_65105 [Tremella mesenterica DSM 1558]|uniref:uncharacterized protein n=1 Tax=Tremella mesenterica (strain ATCC 24925 / CBS 8224 / DSM 1558 / NBRC 9311 / NRRL Y-6157 / RJB 2259-6 / UBC 559-6) TaxID=578456 RepID=UPI00032C1F2D|nr:uncharacterized protein TREMEDRAFT_65105 [Tremella mesenterica DSM 1558]EIW66712.1 hypothetical protein TREMEDRAFT_65105 [Tremella mesenterica DSM 1558]
MVRSLWSMWEERATRVLSTDCYRNRLQEVKQTVNDALMQYMSKGSKSSFIDCPTSVNGFPSGALQVLESAYSRTHMLSVRECHLIAQAAQLDPAQVRTWVSPLPFRFPLLLFALLP